MPGVQMEKILATNKPCSLQYRISEIAKIVKGKVVARAEDVAIRELLTDTRRAVFPESSLFFALKGERRDGHAFLEEAHRKGIRNFIVSQAPAEELTASTVVVVRDVLGALQQLAAYHRSRFHTLPNGDELPVIGITGSNGKTVVKEWLNQLLEDRYTIVRSPKSYNSQIGVPLSVWQMSERDTLAIFEAGISQSGEMEKLQKIIQPTIGIFTNVGDAHASGFLNLRQKVNEKLRLFPNAKTIIYCRDYAELNEGVGAMRRHLKTGAAEPFQIFSWSRHSDGELRVVRINKSSGLTTIDAVHDERTISVSIPFADDASIENAMHCWCLMLHLGIPDEEIGRKMTALQPVAMRLELREGINNTSLINDSYSADLSSLKIALDFLEQQRQHPKRSVILTDFLESGRPEKDLYADIAQLLGEHKVDRMIGIGPVMNRNQAPFRSIQALDSSFFASVEDFRQQFPRTQFFNETILIKGARAFALEQINSLLENQSHQTRLEIDLDALLHNLHAYQQLLPPSTRMMAMVKAFSYGSGSYEIASALQFSKVDYLAVAYADEGVELRKGGITLPVMVMNPDESSFPTLISYHLEPELYSPAILRSFENFLKKEGLTQYPVHIELETGMNRLGFGIEDIDRLISVLQGNNLRVQSVFSHLAASESAAFDDFTKEQAALFGAMSDRIAKALPYPVIRHLANTSGISRHPDLQFDMVRIGIGLYGIDAAHQELREVSTLRSSIAQIKHVRAGDSVSYGRSGAIHRDSRIATVRLGYADGYPRSLGNGKGSMLIRGQLVPTVGHVCMDMTMVDITDVPEISESDEVIVFGKGLPVARVAAWAGTIAYEMLTGVSQRVKRVYFKD